MVRHAGTSRRRWSTLIVGLLLVGAVTACGTSDEEGSDGTADVSTAVPTEGATTTEATAPPMTEPPTGATPTAVGDDWTDAVAAECDRFVEVVIATPLPGPSVGELEAYAAAWRAAPSFAVPADAPDIVTDVGGPEDLQAAWSAVLDEVEAAAASGELDAGAEAAERHADLVFHLTAAIAVAGGACAGTDAEDLGGARLNIPFLGAWQIGSGFDSIWVSREYTNDVERLDPATGEIVATIDVGSRAVKLQQADGRMWVRTADAFVAIDPETNAVAATLAKSEVGPEANRSWAVDGALWICDGDRLHRYDPVSVAPVTVIELGFPCGQVYATDDLAVAWSFNEDDGESGSSRAALIDPATNSVVHDVDLPADANVPVVLNDVVYFPGNLNSRAFTVNREDGAVSEAPDLERKVVGSQPAFDGTSIYVPAKESDEIVVVDASTFEVTEKLPTLGLNSLEFFDGTLWTANNFSGFVQAFDRPG